MNDQVAFATELEMRASPRHVAGSKIRFLLRRPWRLPVVLLTKLPYFRFIRDTEDYQNRINFRIWFTHKVLNLGQNRDAYWPVHATSQVFDADRILAGVDTCPGLMKGCYIQGKGGIQIGDYTQIAPNVGIISANHDIHDTRRHIEDAVRIGEYCWLGMGATVLPGVELGDFTIVGAGSVVTKSFPDGYCVIAGNPARKIKDIDPAECVRYSVQKKYHGYIPADRFDRYRKDHLRV